MIILPLFLFLAAVFSASSLAKEVESTSIPNRSSRPSDAFATKIYRKQPKTFSSAFSSLSSTIDEDEHQLLNDLFDANSVAQQGITPYTVMPASPHTVNQALYASKAWFAGPRDTLNQHGIGFSATYTSVVEGNPLGGLHPKQSAYFDNITLTSIINTEKLFGWHGGYFIMSAAQQDGTSLSWKQVGNQFNVGSAAGGVTMKWVQLFYQQNFFNDRANVNIGRMCAMNEFDVTPILWNYIGTFQAFQSFLSTFNPNASWGSRLKVNLTHDTEARVGIFQVNQPSVNGLNWNFYPSDTYVLFGQYSWNPEFNMPDISSALGSVFNVGESSPRMASEDIVSSDPNIPAYTRDKKLPGHYFIGGFYNGAYGGVLPNSSPFNSATTGARLPDNYAFYCHADQLVYRPNPLLDSGLTLWSQLSYAPQTTAFPIMFQASGGAIYTGLIPGRKSDFTIFGVNYGRWSSDEAASAQLYGFGYPTYELNSELGYRINLTRFCFIQPDIQYIINPGGTGHIPNALVLGMEMGVTF